ncbi:transketolase C-terminal domain-containing protein [Actinocatenispora rupis]|uniref:Transketolase C-terminal domain-containing protein n=1 Tax=Actinocatenispora rupis TaxID=519421 RepID=A0A8J3JAI6_9ACTN|nr:transketolase C-terminal domain-containing protein [Actinocatenispora rupis]GID12448.1 hypothetical protein Aru02nite_33370 [Actinocatenispora rupis]
MAPPRNPGRRRPVLPLLALSPRPLYARECGAVVTVEDHRPEGAPGEAVLADTGTAAPVTRLAVRDLPGSGTPAELRHAAGIDAQAIMRAATSFVRPRPPAHQR